MTIPRDFQEVLIMKDNFENPAPFQRLGRLPGLAMAPNRDQQTY
jgi:hypothetical protein